MRKFSNERNRTPKKVATERCAKSQNIRCGPNWLAPRNCCCATRENSRWSTPLVRVNRSAVNDHPAHRYPLVAGCNQNSRLLRWANCSRCAVAMPIGFEQPLRPRFRDLRRRSSAGPTASDTANSHKHGRNSRSRGRDKSRTTGLLPGLACRSSAFS